MKSLDRLLRRSAQPPVRVTIESHSILVQAADGRCLRTPTTAAFETDLEQALQTAGVNPAADSITVTFDASAAHFDLLRWSGELRSGKRWQQFASARLAHAAGDPSQWSIRVLQDLPPRAALSAALPMTRLTALRKVVARLVAVRIGLLDRINALLARDPSFSGCVVDIGSERVWILVLRAGLIERVRLRRMQSNEASVAEQSGAIALLPILASEWAATGDERELPTIALAGSHAAAAAVALREVFSGDVIALTHRQPRGRFGTDFLHARAPVPAHGWASAAVGIAALCGAVAWAAPDWQQRDELIAARARVQSALASAESGQHAVQPSTRPARRQDNQAMPQTARSREAQNEAQLLSRELSKPWGALFGALESSSNDRVRIVQVDVDSRFRQLQINAEAKSLSELIRYAERLAAAAPVQSAHLAHHEWKTAGSVRVVSARLIARLDSQAGGPTSTPATARSDATGPLAAVGSIGR